MPNRLISEKSPYLLQHADNPVDWYPWGEDAFERARREEKPIFLSVGYSTCYWCHVMEREVFEDEAIAARLNEWAIAIKVDREERPDVDHIYMLALQALTGSGGWPMSIFMTPDRKPFFAATYIPPVTQYGRLGFAELLERIHAAWAQQRGELLSDADEVARIIRTSTDVPARRDPVDGDILGRAFEAFARTYDARFGGFGHAPKFPRPMVLQFLLRYFHRSGTADARDMALTTLRRMALGGIYDQLGGGFHRYATDERWHLPHFEKMAYDQALLVCSLIEAFQLTHEPFFAEIARETLQFVQREMTDAGGGFWSALDAESPGPTGEQREGAFYVWTADDLRQALTGEESSVAEAHFGITPDGNIRTDPRGEFGVANILAVSREPLEIARMLGIGATRVSEVLGEAKRKLYAARSNRPRPGTDDKVLTSWNGLMISAFAKAYQQFDHPEYARAAIRAAEFLLTNLADTTNGSLRRRYRDGESRFEGRLPDYACLGVALIDLYEATFDVRWLRSACGLADACVERFQDPVSGELFDDVGADPTLLIRTRDLYDGAEPSGHAMAVILLTRLSAMLGIGRYREAAERAMASIAPVLAAAPDAMPLSLVAHEMLRGKPVQIVLAGSGLHPGMRALLREIWSFFLPSSVVMLADGGEGQEFLSRHVPFLGSLHEINGLPTAYVCENFACQLPTGDPSELRRMLTSLRPR